jgi:hypothetical protein
MIRHARAAPGGLDGVRLCADATLGAASCACMARASHRRHARRATAVGARIPTAHAEHARGRRTATACDDDERHSVAAANWLEARSLRLAGGCAPPIRNRNRWAGARRRVAPRGRTDTGSIGLQRADGLALPRRDRGGRWVDAEVVGFAGDRTYLMPTADLGGLLPNARVVRSRHRGEVAVGDGLLGRVIDSDGVPLDGRGPIRAENWVGLAGTAINPLMREPISRRSTSACARSTHCFRSAAASASACSPARAWQVDAARDDDPLHRRRRDRRGLIGERGREVRDFVETTLGVEGLRRSVVVATPADRRRWRACTAHCAPRQSPNGSATRACMCCC